MPKKITEWQGYCKYNLNNSEKKEIEVMKGILLRKIVIKIFTILFSVLVWGQPTLGFSDRPADRTYHPKWLPALTFQSTFSRLP